MEDLKINTLNQQRISVGRDRIEKSIRRQQIFMFFKKNKFKILGCISLVLLMIYPEFFGEISGQWINDFVSAFLKNINF